MKTIAIVDDSSIMRKTIEKYIAEYEFDLVGTASNGLDAIALAREKKPDFLTLDITMPEMDGLESLTKILEVSSETKVVVITALADTLTGLEALERGAVGYIFKPLNVENFKETFDDLIS